MITLRKTSTGALIGADIDSVKRLKGLSVGEVIKVKPEKRNVSLRRSTGQNAYYWAVAIEMIVNEIGVGADDLHEALLVGCFGSRQVKIYLGNGNTFVKDVPLKRSKELSTAEFETYLSDVRKWASVTLNMYIPKPNETEYNY